MPLIANRQIVLIIAREEVQVDEVRRYVNEVWFFIGGNTLIKKKSETTIINSSAISFDFDVPEGVRLIAKRSESIIYGRRVLFIFHKCTFNNGYYWK